MESYQDVFSGRIAQATVEGSGAEQQIQMICRKLAADEFPAQSFGCLLSLRLRSFCASSKVIRSSDLFTSWRNVWAARGVASYDAIKPGLTNFWEKLFLDFPVISGKWLFSLENVVPCS